VFVFPSLTDTYGLVMLEALAAGVPVAAFDVTGPREVVGDSGCGILSSDLRAAAMAALELNRDRCRAYGAMHTIRSSAEHFLDIVMTAVGASCEGKTNAMWRPISSTARSEQEAPASISGVKNSLAPGATHNSL
jgi:hypothetical protein